MDETERADEQGAEGRRPRGQRVAVTAVFAVDAGTPPEEAGERALAALTRLEGECSGFRVVGAFYTGPDGEQVAAAPPPPDDGGRRYPLGEEFQDG